MLHSQLSLGYPHCHNLTFCVWNINQDVPNIINEKQSVINYLIDAKEVIYWGLIAIFCLKSGLKHAKIGGEWSRSSKGYCGDILENANTRRENQ